MTTFPWRAALTRWGDPLFRLALLLMDERTAAERATIQAFTRTFATPSEDLEAALYGALLHERPSRRYPFRRRSLPRVLDRIAPADRVLLGAWLLRDIDGPRLLAIAGQPVEVVLPRLAAAILPFLDAQDPALSDQPAREIFDQWLRRRLGLAVKAGIDTTTYDSAQAKEWQSAVDALRQTLRDAVGRQHIPVTCVELIETNMLEPQADEQRWWRQRAALIGAAAVVLALVWIVKPWQQGIGGLTGAKLTSKELVQKTLDGWTTTPVTGTLHHKVIAIEPRLGQRPLTTDVWLSAESTQHRIEVRNGTSLIEWQIGDGSQRLSYAAFPRSSSCDWAVEASALDQSSRTFTLPPEQQQVARDAALTRGAYGQGYLALQAALTAPDLRSFGTRVENKTTLLVLGYTDQRAKPARKLLLWIDPAKSKLHAVREVAAAGGQADARDLWRLQVSEELASKISSVPPSWPGSTLARDRLLEPTCPGLDPDRVVSLRSFVTTRWWSYEQWYLPAKLPDDITLAAMVTPTAVTAGSLDNSAVSAIFVGSNRWVRLRLIPRGVSPSDGIDRGNWLVTFQDGSTVLRGSACRRFNDTRVGFCVPSIEFTAQGWSQDELLSLIDSLKPLDGQSWLEYNDLFLEPQPLTTETQDVVEQSLAAIQQLKQGSLYSIAESRARIDPALDDLPDPYHVPAALGQPERAIQEQWLVYSDTVVTRFRHVIQHAQGDVLSVRLNDGERYSEYYLPGGVVWQSSDRLLRESMPVGSWIGEDLLLSLIAIQGQLTVREESASWLLEQSLDQPFSGYGWFDDRYLNLSGVLAWIDGLPQGTFIHRIWIDRATSLPARATTLHRDTQGRETEIVTLKLSVQPQPEPFADSIFRMPQLPDDVITFETVSSSAPRVSLGSFPLKLPDRALLWNTREIETVSQIGSFDPAAFTPEKQASTIYEVVSASSTDLVQTGLIQATTYRFLANGQPVTVRQGPRNLMRHILRYQTSLKGTDNGWADSKALRVTIAGQEQTAWLLETYNQAMIVFEIDDLLVQIAGTRSDWFEPTVVPALSKLEWAAASTGP